MCGRFAQHASIKALMKLYNIRETLAGDAPAYNISPMSDVLAVIEHRGSRRMGRLKWGLVPPWAKDTSLAPKMINARLETITEKKSFKEPFLKKRCIIPADGFFEWKKEGDIKVPWYFSSCDNKPMALAGLWETWKKGGKVLHTCTIITADASPRVLPVHHRMPVILPLKIIEAWLGTEPQNAEDLKSLVEKHRVMDLSGTQVSRFVNNIKNQGPQCLEPVS